MHSFLHLLSLSWKYTLFQKFSNNSHLIHSVFNISTGISSKPQVFQFSCFSMHYWVQCLYVLQLCEYRWNAMIRDIWLISKKFIRVVVTFLNYILVNCCRWFLVCYGWCDFIYLILYSSFVVWLFNVVCVVYINFSIHSINLCFIV